MGLFTKEPAEKKEYWKAFDKARSKPGEKTFPELEKACDAWPESWQGYLLMGLCYDMGAGVPFDDNKATEYHYKAKAAGKRCGAEWVEIFYEYYDQEALNFRMEREYYPRTLKVRKAGVAMIFSYYINPCGILPKSLLGGDDLRFWEKLFGSVDTGGFFKSTEEQSQVYNHMQPFRTFITHYNAYKSSSSDASGDDTKIRNANDMIKRSNAFFSLKETDITENTMDMYPFVLGCTLFFGGRPYMIRGEGWHVNSRIDAWNYFWRCSIRGCAPATYILATYFNSKEFGDEIYYSSTITYAKMNDKTEAFKELRYHLVKCEEKGDPCATYLLESLEDGYGQE